MSNDTSDDFFSNFSGGTPTKTAEHMNATAKPRPPPAAPTATATANGGATSKPYAPRTKTVRKGAPPPPPPKPSSNGASGARSVRPAVGSTTPAATSTANSSASSSGGYYGTAAYTAPAASTSASNPYYQSTAAAAAAPVATSPAPAASGYPYSSTAAPAYNYGAPAPSATVPQVMNPYMLSTSSVPAPAPADAFSGNMDTGGLSGSMDTNASLSGPMDTSAASQPYMSTSTFVPQVARPGAAPLSGGAGYNPAEFEDELPLLEELGVNVQHIGGKMRSVVLPFQRFGGNMDATVIQDADLAGPIALALLLGGELVLSGKFQFGYIYGFGMFGCVTMTLVLNFMSPKGAISFWTVTSILGYSLLPVNILAAVKLIVVNLGNLQTFGRLLGILTVIWCTVASTRLMEQGCDMRNQRYLIAYPIGLLYTAFVMITIF